VKAVIDVIPSNVLLVGRFTVVSLLRLLNLLKLKPECALVSWNSTVFVYCQLQKAAKYTDIVFIPVPQLLSIVMLMLQHTYLLRFHIPGGTSSE
jgi:hypothetical protein